MSKQYITYYRVSTKAQGKSGLGIDAQKDAVQRFMKSRRAKEIDTFTEVESGRNGNRPILKQAIQRCKETGADLLIAKLDRLARNAKFLFTLKEELEDAGVGFTVADLPDANNLTLGIMAVLAEYESQLKSERLKAAFKEAKKQGRKLGSPENLTKEAMEKAWRTTKENARNDVDTRKAFHFIQPRREQGQSFDKIAFELNKEGYRTRKGKKFFGAQVRKLWIRFTEEYPIEPISMANYDPIRAGRLAEKARKGDKKAQKELEKMDQTLMVEYPTAD